MKVTIKNKHFEVHYSLRAQMAWEEHYNKKFNPSTTEEVFAYYFFVIYACNDIDGDELTFDEFIKEIETDPTLTARLIEAISVKKKTILQRLKIALRVLMG